MSEFSTQELVYLLSLASARRRKRERDAPKIKAGQNTSDFERAHERWKASLAWARQIEDKLILLIAARDQSLLRPGQRDRALELLPNQARYTAEAVDCPLHGRQPGLSCTPCGNLREPCPSG